MKRKVGIVLIALALVSGTIAMDAGFLLAMGVLVPRVGALIQPTIDRVAAVIGVDPGWLLLAPSMLAVCAIVLGFLGEELSRRPKPQGLAERLPHMRRPLLQPRVPESTQR